MLWTWGRDCTNTARSGKVQVTAILDGGSIGLSAADAVLRMGDGDRQGRSFESDRVEKRSPIRTSLGERIRTLRKCRRFVANQTWMTSTPGMAS